MLRAFGEVIVELSEFALGKTASSRLASPLQTTPLPAGVIETYHQHLHQAAARLPEETLAAPLVAPAVAPAVTPAATAPRKSEETGHSGFSQMSGTAYVVSVDTPCYQRPVRALDTIIGQLPYGEKVSVDTFQGRWAKVERAGSVAWVEKDALIEDPSAVFPVLEPGIIYDSSHPITERIRAIIKDDFAATDLLLPLLDVEYITYRLYSERRFIAWPVTRPRLPGQWSKLLRGVKGIHIGIRPMTGSIMEWEVDGVGHLAFVSGVHPDESIEISGVFGEIGGRFMVSRLEKTAWQALAPTFIEIL